MSPDVVTLGSVALAAPEVASWDEKGRAAAPLRRLVFINMLMTLLLYLPIILVTIASDGLKCFINLL